MFHLGLFIDFLPLQILPPLAHKLYKNHHLLLPRHVFDAKLFIAKILNAWCT